MVWRAECNAYRDQIRRVCGEEPEGATLRITSNSHDFGTYHDVAVEYDPEVPGALAYALKVESEAPGEWDEQAHRVLAAAGVCAAAGCEHDTVGCVEYQR